MNQKLLNIFLEIKSLLTLILIIFLLKVTIVEAYIVPTGSMENTIMTGDFLLGSRFNYGVRTPDWIGIPYTDKGYDIPHIRLPVFKKPKQGDIIIFKYPRDPIYKYVKRCIAGPGDVIKIVNRKVFVNDIEYPLSINGKFQKNMLKSDILDHSTFLNKGNKDNIAPVYVPKKGDIISLNKANSFIKLLQIMIMDGHKLTLLNKDRQFEITILNPEDILRRKNINSFYNKNKAEYILRNYYNPIIRSGYSQQNLSSNGSLVYYKDIQSLFQNIQIFIDEENIMQMEEYIVKQDYYWAMGDNRDDSLDSRFWGFVPFDYILGEALFTYFSIDLSNWKGVLKSLLNPFEWSELFTKERMKRIGTVLD